MTPRTDVISQPSNELAELLAEIVYNDINKIQQLIAFYEEANQFLTKLSPDSRKAEKLREYIQPLEVIKKTVCNDVSAHYEQLLGLQAKKEEVIDAHNPNARSWRYVLTTSQEQVLKPSLVLVKFVANHDFFQIRTALVQIISQMDEFITFLKDLAKRVKSQDQASAEKLSRSAADKLILAMQLSSQLSLHGERLTKYKSQAEDVGVLGEHIQALGGLLTTAANTCATSSATSSAQSEQKSSSQNPEQLKLLRKIYLDEKTKLKAASKKISTTGLSDVFDDLMHWQIKKDIVEKEFAKYEKVDAWESLSEESLSLLARKEAIEEEFSMLSKKLTLSGWAELAGAIKELNQEKYRLAYAQGTVESYQDYVLAIFRSFSAKKAKWKECASKNNAALHAERQDKLKANLMTQLGSRMQLLDRLLLEIHHKHNLVVPDTLMRINFSNGTDLGKMTPRSRAPSLVLFGRKRASSATLAARGNASPRRPEVKEMSSSLTDVTAATSSLPSSPRMDVSDSTSSLASRSESTNAVSLNAADSSQSTLTNPGFVGSSRKYEQIVKGVEPVNSASQSSGHAEVRASSDFASKRTAIMQSLKLNLSSVSPQSANSASSSTTVASSPGRK